MYSLSNGAVSNDLQWALTWISRSRCYYRPDALDVLCAQLTRDVFAIVNFLYWHKWNIASRETTIRITAAYWRAGSVLNVQCIFRLLNGPKMAIFLSVQKGGLTYNSDYDILILSYMCYPMLFISAPINVKFGTFRWSVQHSPLWGKRSIFGPLCKQNTAGNKWKLIMF